MVRRAATIEDFLAAPLGAYVVDRAFAYFAPHDDLSGYVVWGRPAADDFQTLARLLPLMHAPTKKPHAVMLDLRAMEFLEAAAFNLAIRYTLDNYSAFGRAITKLALVRSDGVGGAIVAGFFKVVPAYSPLRVFTEIDDALAWLDRNDDSPMYASFDRELQAIRAEPSLVDRLRTILEANPKVSIGEAASKLATSARTLQRRLGDGGTSFTTEVARAQIAVAQRMLAETDATMTEIALQVGCASAQHFSTLFRKLTGEAPTECRARCRAGAKT